MHSCGEMGDPGRRRFLRLAAAAGLGTVLAGCGGEPATPSGAQSTPEGALASATPESARATPGATRDPAQETPVATGSQAYLAVARGADPRAITRAAVAAIGGMELFVKPGYQVIVKPNICVDYHTFEYAATTNPDVVAALVELCLAAGAKRVRVMDSPFAGDAATAYARSGIADAVQAAGGQMELMNRAKYREAAIPQGRNLSRVSVYQELLAADLVIDVPIAKHHNLARLTLAGKNLLGVIEDPGMMHSHLGQRIADLVSLVRPRLTVVDAVRILVDNGPSGGSLDDVRLTNTVIASHDIVAADAYAATLFGLTGAGIDYVREAAAMGLGTLDLESIQIVEIAV